MTRETALVFLRYLKKILLYRIDDPLSSSDEDTLPINEEIFFSHLYVAVPDLERQCLEHLQNYRMPVLLLGKQGIGKTSVLERVLRQLVETHSTTLVRLRCTLADRHSFASVNEMETYLKTELENVLAITQTDTYQLIHQLFTEDPSYLQRSKSSAARNLFTALFRAHSDDDSPTGRNMDLVEWVKYVAATDHGKIRQAIRAFDANIDLNSLVDIVAVGRGRDHRILFVIDNVESLVDLESIRTAVRLLVRFASVIGERGKLLVASRPRSYQISEANRAFHLPDAGHNLFEIVDFSGFLAPVFVEESEAEPALDLKPGGLLQDHHSRTHSRYWTLLLKRFEFMIKQVPAVSSTDQEELLNVFEGIRAVFSRVPECSHVIAGLANHSCRSLLITIVNYVEHLWSESRDLSNIKTDPLTALTPNGWCLTGQDVAGVLMSDIFYFVSSSGTEMPGVRKFRPKLAEIATTFQLTGQIPYASLAPFYIMKLLDGCPVARFQGEARRPTRAHPLSVDDIVAMLVPFGFSETILRESLTDLALPDDWDQQILEFASDTDLRTGDNLAGRDLLQLESRGWLLANVLPFRFHYWRGDCSLVHSHSREVDRRKNLLSIEVVDQVVESVVSWAAIEMQLVRSCADELGNSGAAFDQYGRVTNVPTRWLFVHMLRLFKSHFERFAGHSKAVDADGVILQQYIKQLSLGRQCLLDRLSNALIEIWVKSDESGQPIDWRNTGPNAQMWRRLKGGSAH